jgi:hypothetical protein
MEATVKDYLTVRTEGKREVSRSVAHYNLEAIIAVGYRVRSRRGTQFRRWATEQLREFLVKGFAMDDARLKAGSNIGSDYFDELLEPFEISARARSASTRRSETSMLLPLTMILLLMKRSSSFASFRTSSTLRFPERRPQS